MVKIRITATAEDAAKAGKDQGEFVLPKVGLYVMNCLAANAGHSKGDDGNEDIKKPRVEFIYKFEAIGKQEAPITENYGQLWDYMSFSESSGWKRVEVGIAYGFLPEGYDGPVDFEMETDDCVNRKVLARIKHETQGTGKNAVKRAKIAKLYPYGSLAVDEVAVDYSEPDSDTFGAADETLGDSNVEEKDDSVNWKDGSVRRSQELNQMPLKDLGTILTERGGDPKTCISKDAKGKLDTVATTTRVIESILSIEFGDTADEADEEDPF